jgi:hypothetical protein
MKTGAWWMGMGLAMSVSLGVGGGCSGRLDYEPAEYMVGAAGSGGNAMTPPATGGAGAGSGGGGGSGSGSGGASAAGSGGAGSGSGGAGGAGTGGVAANGGAGGGGGSQQPPKSDAGIGAEVGGAEAGPAASACPPGKDALGIMAAKCGNCHGAVTPTKGLDVVSPNLAARLVGVKSACGARPFLETTGTAGYFLDKLDGPVAGCGGQMPFGTPPLTPEERGCIDEWARLAIARGVSGR